MRWKVNHWRIIPSVHRRIEAKENDTGRKLFEFIHATS